ncbi:Peptidoglycan/xylan/chitin deacetylase, PgdA/CDA1 family [Psychrobacillus psychrotolerans]|uniref:Peptidoglycan/xylan/chitin deacetylase, PgdA/CDA1 family n=1 Tax=Psychrobacillus psychrotolerans TaxID=126156 RepID=A0A1I5WQM7_9BACI|nr:Peptidoglycan/xylan/chitin deacetylase, PgdA/CDA1 family [Psychrobacillus psychrotolerans]
MIILKHTTWMISAVMLLGLSACSDGDEKPKTVKESNETTTVSQEPVVEEVEEVVEEEVVIQETETLYELNEANWTFKPIEDANPKAVLLTIDDAPEKYAVEMAKTLKELNAPAIFFVNGHFLDTDDEKNNLKAIYDMGFSIGNHTQTHVNLKESSEEQQKEEIIKVNETVEAVIGEKPKFFRAPFGINTDFSKSLVKQEGMLLMNWTYGYDWEKQYRDAASLTDIMVNTEYLTDGANLLMHDREWTAQALRGIVEGLRANGYDLIDPKTIKGIQ